jgi:biotin--protein ligase
MKKKVGGILVNTSFSGGNVDVVVGFGVNVSTPAPVTSLSHLSPPGQQLGAETLLALVLTEFERLWVTFIQGKGGWAPFEEAYLEAWMHSDQLVTLTTVEPPRPVRIVGITHDYGLLRTLPERTGWSKSWSHGAEDDYIDLQPDGNSFDIMTGLIKAKK